MKKLIVSMMLLALAMPVLAKGSGGNGGGGRSGAHSYKGAKAIDGDTFRYGNERYRIQQYNAPELGSPGAAKATRQLQGRIDSGGYNYKPVARDVYGRRIVNEQPIQP